MVLLGKVGVNLNSMRLFSDRHCTKLIKKSVRPLSMVMPNINRCAPSPQWPQYELQYCHNEE